MSITGPLFQVVLVSDGSPDDRLTVTETIIDFDHRDRSMSLPDFADVIERAQMRFTEAEFDRGRVHFEAGDPKLNECGTFRITVPRQETDAERARRIEQAPGGRS